MTKIMNGSGSVTGVTRHSLGRMGERQYVNPLAITYGEGDTADRAHPDPFVLKYAGEYYCYSTSYEGVTVLHSRNMVDWRSSGFAIKEEEKNYWAPCVIYYNGLFYMYYSSGDTETHFQLLKVAVSSSPLGPFIRKKTLFDYFSIDAHVVKDSDGSLYLFYSVDQYAGTDENRPGTVILVDRLLDPVTLAGEPRLVVGPTIDEEISGPNRFGDGRDWHTLEGAFYLKRGSRHYLMYSGNSFEHEHYFVGYATGGENASIGDSEWIKWPSPDTYAPILRKNEGVSGTGHHSVAEAPNLIDQWVMYHGREAQSSNIGEQECRHLRADPLLWQGNDLWVPGPTYTVQDAPAMPSFRELFEAGGAEISLSSARWIIDTGDWSVLGGAVRQEWLGGEGRMFIAEHFGDFVFEGWSRWEQQMTGGRYGFVLEVVAPAHETGEAWKGTAMPVTGSSHIGALEPNSEVAPTGAIEMIIDAGHKEVLISEVSHGIRVELAKVRLPKDFNASAYQVWRIIRRGGHCVIQLNNLDMYNAALPLSIGHGESVRMGLVTLYTSAAFAGIAATRHYETDFRSGTELAGRFRCSGRATLDKREGMLVRNLKGRTEVSYAGPYPTNYTAQLEFECRLSALDAGAGVTLLRNSAGDIMKLKAVRDNTKNVLKVVYGDFTENCNAPSTIYGGDLVPMEKIIEGSRVMVYMRKFGTHLQVWLNGSLIIEHDAFDDEQAELGYFVERSEMKLTRFALTEWK